VASERATGTAVCVRRRASYSLSARSTSGFTLVETLIAATLGAVLIVALINLFGNMMTLSATMRQRAELRRDAELASILLHRDLSQADAVLGFTKLSLSLLAANGDTIRYAWNGTKGDSLTRQVDSGAAAVVAANVDTVGFLPLSLSRPFLTERVIATVIEDTVAKFDENDYDPWLGPCDCSKIKSEKRRVEDDNWCGTQFWDTEAFGRLTRVSLRLKADDHFPPEVDMIIDVHEDNSGRPGTVISTGRLSRLVFMQENIWEWHDVTLEAVGSDSIVAGDTYWILLKPPAEGGHTYAGHANYKKIEGCDDCWPTNSVTYRFTNDGGSSWNTPYYDMDICFFLYGSKSSTALNEITQTLVDTTGVEFYLALEKDNEREVRAGHISLEDL